MSSKLIRFRDLRVVDPERKRALLQAVDRVLTSGQILMGAEVEAFERRFAQACGRRFCVAVSSGTDALYVALRALDIGPGDEVVTSAMSWVATVNAIHLTGATPVLVDITVDQIIDPGLIEAAITPRTKAVLPVHFTGRLCDMPKILSIAAAHGLSVVEDAAQAFGASAYGAVAGGFGTLGAFSLNPMKTFPGYGEFGAVVGDDPALHERLIALRYLGTIDKEVCKFPALNHKADEIQAAMMLTNFDHLEAWTRQRLDQAAHYNAGLDGCVGVPRIEGLESVFFDYQIQVPHSRDELRTALADAGIETKVRHPLLMDDHPAYRHLRADIPVARDLVKRILSLPLHEFLTRQDQDEVIAAIRGFYRRND